MRPSTTRRFLQIRPFLPSGAGVESLCEHPAMGFLSDQGHLRCLSQGCGCSLPEGRQRLSGRRPIPFVFVVIFLIVAIGPFIANLLLDWLR
jgi:hypothetical protein